MSLSQLLKSKKSLFVLYMLIAQGFFMLSNLYINHYVNKIWDVEGFATFNLIKRIASFIVFPLLVGAGIGIPRYISFIKSKDSQNHSYEYLLSGFLIFFGAFSLFGVVVFCFPHLLLSAFKGSIMSKGDLLSSILLYILSQGLFVLISAYYRGKLAIGKVSIFNILVMSLLPLAGLYVVTDVVNYFFYYSLLTLAIIACIMVYLYFKSSVSVKRISYKTNRLFRYGYPRIVAELGLFALEFMPVFLISVYVGLKESGYISMTFILMKLAAMAYELIGSLVLPYFGKLFKQGNSAFFISKVNQMLLVGFFSSVFITALFYFLIPIGINTFFPTLANSIISSQLIFIVFPVYSLYLLLRNVLDVVSEKALNSVHLSVVSVVQLLILLIGFYFKLPFVYSIFSIVVPYFFLGLLTYVAWMRIKAQGLKHTI